MPHSASIAKLWVSGLQDVPAPLSKESKDTIARSYRSGQHRLPFLVTIVPPGLRPPPGLVLSFSRSRSPLTRTSKRGHGLHEFQAQRPPGRLAAGRDMPDIEPHTVALVLFDERPIILSGMTWEKPMSSLSKTVRSGGSEGDSLMAACEARPGKSPWGLPSQAMEPLGVKGSFVPSHVMPEDRHMDINDARMDG